MDATVIRRYLQPSPTLRWHPWAPLVAAGVFTAFVFGLGAAWGYSAAKRMAADESIYIAPGWLAMDAHFEATQPARRALQTARSFDAAVIRAAREARANESTAHRARISVEDSLFGLLEGGRRARDRFDSRAGYRQAARRAAEYRIENLSGAAPSWRRTANLCQEVGRGWDMTQELTTAASAYTAVLGRAITVEHLAPLPGVACN